jgi:hypothetical protein
VNLPRHGAGSPTLTYFFQHQFTWGNDAMGYKTYALFNSQNLQLSHKGSWRLFVLITSEI